jgi:hypothetical protein
MRRLAKKARALPRKRDESAVKPARRSWTALVAATTLGLAGASLVEAQVQSDARLDDRRSYRLIVQSYEDGDLTGVDPQERPVASVQRAITGEELRHGVRVGLLDFRHTRRNSDGKPVVLAWVEEGQPDLELDGLRARPQPGSLLGAAPYEEGNSAAVQISVKGLRETV